MDVVSANDRNNALGLLSDAYASRVNNLKLSLEYALEALQISRSIGDQELIGKSLNQLSLYHMIMGDYEPAIRYAEEAARTFEALNDEVGVADARYNLAGVYYKTDNFHLGLVHLIDCLVVYRRVGDYHNQSRVEKSLGTVYEYFGDQINAVRSYENAVEAGEKAGDLNLISNAYNNLSGVYLKQNRIEKAFEIIEKSIAIKEQTGDVRGLAFALYGRAKVLARLKQYDKAEKDYLESVRIHISMQERLGLGMTYHKLGAMYVETGELEKAKEVLRKGVEVTTKYNVVFMKFRCEKVLYEIYKQEGNAELALQHLEEYIKGKEIMINSQTAKIIENYELIMKVKNIEREAQIQKERMEMNEKKKRAEEAVRVRQEFLSTMSHELRTPLNAITTISSMLKARAEAEEQQLITALSSASEHLLHLINDILDFTRLDSGKEKLEPHSVRIRPFLEHFCKTYESKAGEKGLKLTSKIDASIADVYEMDEAKVSQILANLVTNAIKFTYQGKVELEISRIAGDQSYDQLRFVVADTGEGIAEQYLREIFDSFSHIKPAINRKQGGTGLGLAIVKKLVELHGGDIKVQSTEGQGSVFSFELRLKKVAAADNNGKDLAQSLRDKNALLVEDNEINAFVAMKLLKKWGVNAELAVNGLEALEKTKAKSFDFILMDIHMPEMNGFDATVHIRTGENPNSKTPIFALTADVTAANYEEYFDYFNGFLWKPLQIDKLHEVLSAESI